MTRILVAAGVLTQIAYPLTSGHGSVVVTVLSVLLFAGAALAHAFSTFQSGWAPLAVLGAAAGIGGLAEVLGVHTGVPFGSYHYTSVLGPHLFGVPVLVPLAWTMLAYPCLLLGRRLVPQRHRLTGQPNRMAGLRTRVGVAVFGGLTLAAWDLFLDPQMVALGAWQWRFPSPALPGVPGVPLTNYAGWVVVSVIMVTVMDHLLDVVTLIPPLPGREELVPATVLAWTWAGSTIGNLAFFGRPAVALYGGVAMGLLVVPYLLALRGDARSRTANAHDHRKVEA